MFAPVPARIKKTDIVRSRGGCCDENKPNCQRCLTASAECQYGGVALQFREVTQWAARKVERSKAATTTTRTPPDTSPDTAVPMAEVTEATGSFSSGTATEDMWAGAFGPLLPPGDYASDQPSVSDSSDYLDPQFSDVSIHIDPLPSGCNSIDALFTDMITMSTPSLGPDTVVEADAEIEAQMQTMTQSLVTPPDIIHDSTALHLSPLTVSYEANWTVPKVNETRMLHSERCLPAEDHAYQADTPLPSLYPDDSSLDQRIYLAHVRLTLLQMFPLELPFLWGLVLSAGPVRFAALALAAANLANLHGKQVNDDKNDTWIAMPVHLAKAAAFSSQAVAALQLGDQPLSLDARLAMMLLKVYYELEVGSYGNALRILAAINTIILKSPEDVLLLPDGSIFVRWWLYSRVFVTAAQGAHVPSGPELLIEPLVSLLEQRVATPAHSIYLIGSKASRIWHRVLFIRCFGLYGDTSNITMEKVSDWWDILKGKQVLDTDGVREGKRAFLTEDELYTELRGLHMALRMCDAPTAFEPAFVKASSPASQTSQPLRFASHQQAMELADYAFAQMVCDESLLRQLAEGSRNLPQQFPEEPTPAANNPWVSLLLRVAAGLDLKKCRRENAYRRGIVASLYYAGIFCPGQVSLPFITGIVQRLLDTHTYFEGPFYPLKAFMRFLRVLLHQITTERRTIFNACRADDEWTPKEQLFAAGRNKYCMLVGCEADGRYFNDLVPSD
ncbi:hypothetical protein DV737_g4279, partial [Chaetothyriales sp. CBS 132003]